MLKNKTRAHAPEPKMATVEKHAPRNYVAFKNIKKNWKNLRSFKSSRIHVLRGGSEVVRRKSNKNIVNYLWEELLELGFYKSYSEEDKSSISRRVYSCSLGTVPVGGYTRTDRETSTWLIRLSRSLPKEPFFKQQLSVRDPGRVLLACQGGRRDDEALSLEEGAKTYGSWFRYIEKRVEGSFVHSCSNTSSEHSLA